MPLAIDGADIHFRYGAHPVLALERFQLESRQSMAVIGPSGCGKTTLLHVLAGLLRPTTGRIRILGQDLSGLKGSRLDRFRGQHIGLVFQRFHLLPALSVRENIALGQRLSGQRVDTSLITSLSDQLGLTELQSHKPSALSQGQAQRVAIARALVNGPKLILADEPTSALDDAHAGEVVHLLKDAAKRAGAALLVVTHDQRVRGQFESEYGLRGPL